MKVITDKGNPYVDFAEEVTAGFALLDYVSPDWLLAIDLPRLDLASVHHCVLGQVVAQQTVLRTAVLNYLMRMKELNPDEAATWLDYSSADHQLNVMSKAGELAVIEAQYGHYVPERYGFVVSDDMIDFADGQLCDVADDLGDYEEFSAYLYEELGREWLYQIALRQQNPEPINKLEPIKDLQPVG